MYRASLSCRRPGATTYCHTYSARLRAGQLNSHLDLLSDQGVLLHLLAIEALQRQGRQSYFFPGIDVWFSADDSDRAGADLFGILDGRIISGEVKTSASEFTPEQLSRDVDLSSRLQADAHVLADHQ